MSDFTEKMAELQEIHDKPRSRDVQWGRLFFQRVFGLIIYMLLDLHVRICDLEELKEDK